MRADREPRGAALRARPRRRHGPAGRAARSRACASSRSAASGRRARWSIRASRCTSCGCTSGPRSSRRCARPPRSPPRRTSPRCSAAGPASFEHELEALINYTFRSRGGSGPGYSTIVGAGDNATILHYIENRCAIARRRPRAGRRRLRVRALHRRHHAHLAGERPVHRRRSARSTSSCSTTQKSAIAMARPGVTLDEIHDHCVRRLTEGDDRARPARRHRRRARSPTELQQVLHARHVALARPRRPRRRRVHPRRQGAPARARHGDHRRARPLHRAPTPPTRPTSCAASACGSRTTSLVTADGHEVLTAACPKEIDEIEHACRA